MPPLEGIPVSPGYAEGTAIVYAYEIERRLEVSRRSVSHSEIGTEYGRLDDAVEQSNRELNRAEQSARSDPSRADSADLLAAHSRLVDDVAAKVKQRMGRELVNVEQALDDVINEFVERLCQLENSYLGERHHDIRDVGRRILRHLTGASPVVARALAGRLGDRRTRAVAFGNHRACPVRIGGDRGRGGRQVLPYGNSRAVSGNPRGHRDPHRHISDPTGDALARGWGGGKGDH